MPVHGDWKKPFAAAQEMVRNSLKSSAYLALDQIRKLAAKDIILGGTIDVKRKNGQIKKQYIEVKGVTNMPRRNGKSKKKIFHNTRFVSRTGNLLEQLQNGPITVDGDASGATATLKLNDRAARSLTQKKGGRAKVELTDKNGNPKTATVRRRPMELARNKVFGAWKSNLKKLLDGSLGKIK
jgi:hypothetical protein